MDALINSFSAGGPSQLDNFIAYTGPPPAKRREQRLPKPSESRRVFDDPHAQTVRTVGIHGGKTLPKSSVDYGLNVVGVLSSGPEAPAICDVTATYDREPYGGSTSSWPCSPDILVNGVDSPLEPSGMWENMCDPATFSSVDGGSQSSIMEPPAEPVSESSLVCVTPSVSSSTTSQSHISPGALGNGYGSKLGSLVSACSPVGCSDSVRGRAESEHRISTSAESLRSAKESVLKDAASNTYTQHTTLTCSIAGRLAGERRRTLSGQGESPIVPASFDNCKQTHGPPDQANSEDMCGESSGCDSNDDVVWWKSNWRRNRPPPVIGRQDAQGTKSSVRERSQSISSSASSNDLSKSARVSSFRCDREGETPNSTESRGGGKHNSAPEQRRHYPPKRNRQQGVKPRINTSPRRIKRLTEKTKPNRLQVSAIAPTLPTRRLKRLCRNTSAAVSPAHQHNPASALVKGEVGQPTWAVDRIVRSVRKHGKTFYKVKWKPTWEPAESLQGTAEVAIAEFHSQNAAQPW